MLAAVAPPCRATLNSRFTPPSLLLAQSQESGIRNWRRVPALNTDSTFIDDLADAVLEALPHVGRFGGGRSAATISSGGPGAGVADAAVPVGDLEALLGAYDRERRTLPAPVGPWEWGFTKSAETWWVAADARWLGAPNALSRRSRPRVALQGLRRLGRPGLF